MVASAVIGGISSLFGAGASAYGASQQASAAGNAAQVQQNMFNQTQHNLKPFIEGGQTEFSNLLNAIPELSKPFNPTMQDLAATPGYQFVLGQGLRATQNGSAAQGLGRSGPALAGAANYAEGLAGTTYQQQFQNYLAQNQQRYNMLAGPASLGEQAAAGQGGISAQVGQNIGNSIIGQGNAIAGGAVGVANSLQGGANNYLQYALMQSLLANQQNGGIGGGGGSIYNPYGP